MNFLSAHWKHLLLANYVVDRQLLEPLVPQHTSLDTFDGKVFVSLVAFLFDHTRLLGMPIPFHRKFEEVNLRFYVTPDKDPAVRAVTFVKEIVPKRAIPLIANSLFAENYATARMCHGQTGDGCWYAWGDAGGNRISARIEPGLAYPAPGSIGEFITEHYRGYAQGRKSTLEYRVAHPPWRCGTVTDFQIAVDFGENYGEPFDFLSDQPPCNVLYAEGSPVTVSFPARLRAARPPDVGTAG